MNIMQRKTNKFLVGILIACSAVAILYVASCLVFAAMAGGAGDPDLPDFVGVFSYHFRSLGELLSFSYGDGSVGYFALSAFLFALPICWVIFLVNALLATENEKRKLIWWAIGMVFMDVIVYAVFASGFIKYMKTIAGEGVFEGQTLLAVLVSAILGLGAIHFVLSMLSYFWSIIKFFKNPRVLEEEEVQEPEEQPQEELQEEQKVEEEAPIEEKKEKIVLKKRGKGENACIIQNFYRE